MKAIHSVICGVCGAKFKAKRAHASVCPDCVTPITRVRSRAYIAVNAAMYRGEIPFPHTLKCVDCGATDETRQIQYDHRRYSKPLDVDPVCGGCNLRRGHAKDLFSLARKFIGLRK